MPGLAESKLIEKFSQRESFSRQDLLDFYRKFEPELKEGTLGWRIYDLKNKNIIRSIRRGIYVISYKPKYKPDISKELSKVITSIPPELEDIKYCVWESSWINEFAQHQSNKRMVLIEVEKGYIDSFYYQMKDRTKYELYLEPKKKEIEFYVSESNFPVIIKRLVSRSPLDIRQNKNLKFHTPQLEKILVDLFAEEEIYYFFRGYELIYLFENAISKYSLNFTRLFSYAKRRDKENNLQQFLSTNFGDLLSNVLDD